MNINHFGTLYVVATPIGNLQDMSPRAVEILQQVDLIAAEDTRHSAPLLQHFLITTPMCSLHEHNEKERADQIFQHLRAGKSVALISDAGTPLINDPGYVLVSEARKLGMKVVPVPGACAVIAALSVAGLPTDRFCYEGFLPAKSANRVRQLQLLQKETRTMVFYEAPHRVVETLEDMLQVFGVARQVVIARELTKMYETVYSAALIDLLAWVKSDANQQRGEIVLLVAGAGEATNANSDTIDSLLKILLADLPLKQAVDLAAKISGQRKNEVYQRALDLKRES